MQTALAHAPSADLGSELDIPFCEREEFETQLPAAAKADVLAKFDAIRFVLSSPGQRWRRCAVAAQRNGLTQSTVYESTRTWLVTRNWRDLVDRRLVKSWQQVSEVTALTPAMEAECVRRISFHKGGVRRAWLGLLREIAEWRGGGQPVEGFGATPPADAPGLNHPAGLSYKNFSRFKKKATCAAIQLGRRGAEEFLPMVRTTRVGVEFGREWFMDDMYENIKAIVPGQLKPRRIIRLHIEEYLTAYLPLIMSKPLHAEEGSDGLKHFGEKYAAYLVMRWATQIGVHPSGGRLMGEGGTATLRREMRERLLNASNGLFKFDPGVAASRTLVAGQNAATGKGKPQAKAQLESAHNLIQRESANLLEIPGQIGRNPDDQPEELYGREIYAEKLLKLVDTLAPGARENLRYGFLALAEALTLLAKVQERIHDEEEHALEGWSKIGHTKRQWRWSAHENWQDWSALEAQPDEVKAQFVARLEQGEAQARLQKMSRREAWIFRQTQTQLTRLPLSLVPHVLGEDLMTCRRVTSRGEIVVASEDAGDEPLYFRAVVDNAMLEPGHEYQTWFNPLDPERLLVRDLSGRWLGTCAQHAVRRDDAPAVLAARQQKKLLANAVLHQARELMGPVVAQQQADRAWNEAIIAGARPDAASGQLPAKPTRSVAKKARASRFARMAATGQTAEEIAAAAAQNQT